MYAYVGEFHDSHFRPKVVSWTAAFIGFGNMYVPGMAWLILSQHWEYQIPLLGTLFRPWRLLIIMYSLPSIIFAICVYFLPESPKFLLSQGRDEEVLKILRKMYRINFGRNHNEYQVTAILWDEDSDLVMKKGGLFKSIWEQTKPLFQRSYCLKTILISFLQFTNYLTWVDIRSNVTCTVKCWKVLQYIYIVDHLLSWCGILRFLIVCQNIETLFQAMKLLCAKLFCLTIPQKIMSHL